MSFINKLDLYCISLSEEYAEREIAGFQFKIINNISEIHYLEPLLKERGLDYEEAIKSRLNSGVFYCFCFLDESTKKVAYSRWLRKDSFFHDKYKKKISLKVNEGFTMDSYTVKQYRGMGLHVEMNKRMLNYCKNEMHLKNIYMVIFSGKEFTHLHKTVKKLGYYKIDSVIRLNYRYAKQILSIIKKIYA